MTDKQHSIDSIAESLKRRSFLKKGALTTAGAGLAVSSTGTAAAQEADDGLEEDNLFVQEQAQKGLMFIGAFRPRAPFTVISPVLQFQPDVDEVEDNVWSGYNKRVIKYLDTSENALFFPANAAEMGPFDEQFGFVPDDEFFQEGAFDDGNLQNNELAEGVSKAAVKPQVFVMDRENNFFGDSEQLVTVQFSEVREEAEEAIYNEFGLV